MNRRDSAIFVVAALLTPMAEAFWYGYLDIGPRYSEVAGQSDTAMDSRGSFLGYSARQALSAETHFLLQFEYEVDADADSDKDLLQNDTFLGLETSLGTIRAGNLETPLRHLADPVDRFPDTAGDPSALWNGDIQASDSVYYQSPRWHGFRAELAMVRHDAYNNRTGISAALWYETDNAGIALASEEHVAGDDSRRHRLTLYRNLKGFELGFTAERESLPGQKDSLARLVSLARTSQTQTFKVQYGKSDLGQIDTYLSA